MQINLDKDENQELFASSVLVRGLIEPSQWHQNYHDKKKSVLLLDV